MPAAKSCGASGRPGHQLGAFTHGHTIAIDRHGHLYVGETHTGRRVQRFSPRRVATDRAYQNISKLTGAVDMDHSPIGRSGPIVSRIGLGCNNFGGRLTEAESRPIIDRALDLGVTFFDTADSYGDRGGSETVLGNVLGARRKDLVLATKFGRSVLDASKRRTGNGRAYVVEAVEGSLRRLRTDWIDLYQVHFPDPATSILETIGAPGRPGPPGQDPGFRAVELLCRRAARSVPAGPRRRAFRTRQRSK